MKVRLKTPEEFDFNKTYTFDFNKTYTKEEFLKAAEIGEVSMIEARHIVSLLDEARQLLKKNQ